MQAWTRVGIVAVGLLLPGCYSDPNARLPDSLTAPDTEANLKVNAGARDGCAFAGTWEFGALAGAAGGRYGTIVFEVIEGRIRAAYNEWYIETLPNPFDAYFAIFEGAVAPGGRSASGKWELVDYRDRTPYSGGAHFKLSADGLSYLDRWWSEGGFAESKGEKVRTGPCGVVVPFVQDAFDYVRDGKPIPEAYGN